MKLLNMVRNLFLCLLLPLLLGSCLTAKNFYAPERLRVTPINGGEKWYEYSLNGIDRSEPRFKSNNKEQLFAEFNKNGSCYTGTDPSMEETKYWTVFEFRPDRLWILLETFSDCDKSEKLNGDIKYLMKMPMRNSISDFVYAIATVEEDAVAKWAENLSWSKRKRYEVSNANDKWEFSNIEGAKVVFEQNLADIKIYEVAYSPVKAKAK